jgi:hypothetical protein
VGAGGSLCDPLGRNPCIARPRAARRAVGETPKTLKNIKGYLVSIFSAG